MTDINEMERRIYKMQRKQGKKNTDETLLGTNFHIIESEYYDIYYDYLSNLLLNLITYKNAPETLDSCFLEFMLRQYGYCRVVALDKDNIYIDGTYNQKEQNGMFVSNIGALLDGPNGTTITSPDGTGTKLNQITQATVNTAKNGYVLVSNKYNYYIGGVANVFTDMKLIDRVAKTLAHIKATMQFNINQMKTPYVLFSKNKNLTAKNAFLGVMNGTPCIELDGDMTSINDVMQVANLQTPNYLPTLKDAFNNEFDEFLTMVGINTTGIDKKERLVANEANANAQLTEASANIYLTARNKQFELINKVVGTNIKAVLNQESVENLLKLKDDTNNAIDKAENNTNEVENN